MPLVFLLIGLAVLSIGLRGRAGDAMVLLSSELTGPQSFVQWFLAIMILGVIGYWRPARPVADAMLGLVLVALFVNKGQGFFANLETAFKNTTPAPSKPVAVNNASIGAGVGSAVAGAVQQGATVYGQTGLPPIPSLPDLGSLVPSFQLPQLQLPNFNPLAPTIH